MKKFNEEIKKKLQDENLVDVVLEIGWNWLQIQKEGDSV